MAPSTTTVPPEARGARRELTCAEIDALMAELGAALPGPRRARLRERVITALMPLARRLCSRFRGYGDEADLLQVAYLGLIKAVDGYDARRGHAFLSYAVPTVRGELSRYARDHGSLLRLPRAVQEARGRVRAARAELEQERPAAPPTALQLAARTGLAEADVAAALGAEERGRPLSLDAPAVGRPGTTALADCLGGDDGRLELTVDLVALRPALAALPRRDREILYLRFYEELTQQQIAERIGVSQMQVSRLLRACLQRLRLALEAPADAGPARPGRRSGRPGRERGRPRAAAAREVAGPGTEMPAEPVAPRRTRVPRAPRRPAWGAVRLPAGAVRRIRVVGWVPAEVPAALLGAVRVLPSAAAGRRGPPGGGALRCRGEVGSEGTAGSCHRRRSGGEGNSRLRRCCGSTPCSPTESAASWWARTASSPGCALPAGTLPPSSPP